MIASEILAKGVERGIITAEQAQQLRALTTVDDRTELVTTPDDEQLRFVSGFSDIFVTIGLAMFLGAIGYFALSTGGTLGMWPAVAFTAWLLAEFFTRQRRMALPSIVLLIVFAWAVFAAVAVFLGAGARPYSYPQQTIWSLFGAIEPTMLTRASLATVLLTALHYWRFRVPITVAAGCGALFAAIMGLAHSLVPQGAHNAIILVGGLAIFGLAMRFDMADPGRLTRRTDIAFWLHLLAAPLIVHSLIDGLFNVASKLEPGQAIAVMFVFLALSLVAVLIDRRALLVSGLSYAGVAFWTLIRQVGVSDVTTPLTILILGAFVLLLSAGWKPLRAGILKLAPSALTRRLPQPTLSV